MNGAYLKNIGIVDLSAGTYHALVYDSDYTPDLAADDTYSDIPPGAIIVDDALSGVTFADGVFDADDITYTSPPAARTPAGIVIYQAASPSSGALLICQMDDEATYAGLGTPTDGSNLRIVWPNGTSKIMRFVNPA
jgi:hypothetical protein